MDKIKKDILVPYSSVLKKEYVMHLSNGPHSASIRFFFREVLVQWSDETDTWLLPTTILVLDNPNNVKRVPLYREIRLNKAFELMLNHLSLKKSDRQLLESFHEAEDDEK